MLAIGLPQCNYSLAPPSVPSFAPPSAPPAAHLQWPTFEAVQEVPLV